MHRYFIKTPRWVRLLFPAYVWHVPTNEKEVFLTLDDCPHPQVTPWVLDELARYNAKATFFCVGNNVVQYADVYRRILAAGHAVGNHTHTHVNGWQTDAGTYSRDVAMAAKYIDSNLFRPPYGRIKRAQAQAIPAALGKGAAKIIMWDVLSADFDPAFTPQKCLENVLKNTVAGSVIVFHDSEKAAPNLKYVLPKVLEAFSKAGYKFSILE